VIKGVNVLGVLLGDLAILLNCLLEHLFIDAVGLLVADQPGIDPPQNSAGIQVFRIRLQSFFGIADCLAQATGLYIKFRELLAEAWAADGIRLSTPVYNDR